jgi:hypothetical protein
VGENNKMTHTQLLGVLLKSNGLVIQGDMAKLDWFITSSILKIVFYKFSKKKN